jgi:hypothetical protein
VSGSDNPLLGPIGQVPALTPDESASLGLFGITGAGTGTGDGDAGDLTGGDNGSFFGTLTGFAGLNSAAQNDAGLMGDDPFSLLENPTYQPSTPLPTNATVGQSIAAGSALPAASSIATGVLGTAAAALGIGSGGSSGGGIVQLLEEVGLRAALILVGLVFVAVGFMLAGRQGGAGLSDFNPAAARHAAKGLLA